MTCLYVVLAEHKSRACLTAQSVQ